MGSKVIKVKITENPRFKLSGTKISFPELICEKHQSESDKIKNAIMKVSAKPLFGDITTSSKNLVDLHLTRNEKIYKKPE